MKLSVKHGSFAYKVGTPVLTDLSFDTESGDLLAILGPNGTGKTTLLRCLTDSLHWNQGRSCLDGKDIRTIPARTFWSRVSYVPQAKGAASSLSAEDMILLGRTGRLGLFSAPGKADIERAHELAERLHISYLLEKKCTEMSGGELQMVLIARALAAEPELIILDEPESNLDFRNQLIVLNTISSLSASGMCCIFNTHYPTHALMRANKSLILKKGGGSIFGNTAEVLTETNIQETFGVKTVIGEVETDGNIYQTILPLSLASKDTVPLTAESNTPCIAVISVIFSDINLSERINRTFHDHQNAIIGRMGLPDHGTGMHIITVTMDSQESEVRSLTQSLQILPGVNVKATLAKK